MTTLRISLWRPMRFSRKLYYSANSEAQGDTSAAEPFVPARPEANNHFSRERLYEEIYSWSPNEDVWGGFIDENLRTHLRNLLSSTFDASIHPGERGTNRLSDFLEQLGQAMDRMEATAWMSSQQPIDTDDSALLLVSPTHAFFCQLTWLLETFRDSPEISITVR